MTRHTPPPFWLAVLGALSLASVAVLAPPDRPSAGTVQAAMQAGR
ncbi:hypothetical protein [Jannaschia sp. W003]|nr:hypothetical protein [Jannaschia sp. W003]